MLPQALANEFRMFLSKSLCHAMKDSNLASHRLGSETCSACSG